MSGTADGGLAAAEAADVVAQELDGACRLAIVLCSPHHLDDVASAAAVVRARLEPEMLIGAVAQGIVGPGVEAEGSPAVAVWAASFEGGELIPLRTAAEPVRGAGDGIAITGWPELEPGDVTVLLADPHTYPAGQVVDHLGENHPTARVIGGLVTPGRGGGRLLLGTGAGDPVLHDDGAVGAVLRDVPVRTVVSQGCRPVGEPLVVTRSDRNVIHELAGEPAADRLRAIFAEAEPMDQIRMQAGLHIGVVADEYTLDYQRGDFLIRGVIGADEETGALAVGDAVEVGRTVQFHVRDADSADEDLREALREYRGQAAGALLFTCNGRGRRFFGEPDHDVRLVGETLTDRVAGAFCAGEIGPVGDRTYLHGFTASLAVFGAEGDGPDAD
jgi:small ligand-binding sensory domain FIST